MCHEVNYFKADLTGLNSDFPRLQDKLYIFSHSFSLGSLFKNLFYFFSLFIYFLNVILKFKNFIFFISIWFLI